MIKEEFSVVISRDVKAVHTSGRSLKPAVKIGLIVDHRHIHVVLERGQKGFLACFNAGESQRSRLLLHWSWRRLSTCQTFDFFRSDALDRAWDAIDENLHIVGGILAKSMTLDRQKFTTGGVALIRAQRSNTGMRSHLPALSSSEVAMFGRLFHKSVSNAEPHSHLLVISGRLISDASIVSAQLPVSNPG